MSSNKEWREKGFTLIELLVVIGIIGVLTGLLAMNFVGVRQRTRDGARKSDLRQIQSALEFYRSDNSAYPISGNAAGNFPTTCGNVFTNTTATVTYMRKVSCDPSTSSSYSYNSPLTRVTYCIRACLENANDADRDELPTKFNANNPGIAITGCTLTDCPAGTRSFTLQSP